MGLFGNLGNVLGELDKGLNSVVGEISKQVNSAVNQVQNGVEATDSTQYPPRESEGQGISPVISNNICFYCGTVVGDDAEECSVCHCKLK